MQTDYELIFRHRGGSYHQAMQRFPHVRRLEFENLFTKFPLKAGEAIIDCPSLGGYLQENVSVPVKVTNLDFCPLDSTVRKVSSGDWGRVGVADRVVCLAASHHINDLDTFLESASQQLKTGGFLHLADVDNRNPIRYFLDNFVGDWTSTGHTGIWRNFSTIPQELSANSHLKVLSIRDCPCPWEFESQEQMLTFCRLLFGLDRSPSDSNILSALQDYVGMTESNGKVIVPWKLTYVDFEKYAPRLS